MLAPLISKSLWAHWYLTQRSTASNSSNSVMFSASSFPIDNNVDSDSSSKSEGAKDSTVFSRSKDRHFA